MIGLRSPSHIVALVGLLVVLCCSVGVSIAFGYQQSGGEAGGGSQDVDAPTSVIDWLWKLPGGGSDLAKAAVIAIALLAAFLTVVEVWQLPPPQRWAGQTEAGGGQALSGNTPPLSPSDQAPPPADEGSTAKYGAANLLFGTNFARTVLAGLAGLALVGTFDGFWRDPNGGFQEQLFYLVLFVAFFLALLTTSALMRGVTEALRSRVALARRYPAGGNPLKKLGAWLASWRSAILVFLDTGFNMIQGKNQLQTAAYAEEIEELHRSLVLAVERVRRQLDEAFLDALKGDDPAKPGRKGSSRRDPTDAQVRTSIALMANDDSEVFYVAREAGSLANSFGPFSIAWLAIYTGLPIWYKKSWEEDTEGLKGLLIPRALKGSVKLPKAATLENYFARRSEIDYKAFVVLPLPWQHRGKTEGYRKAGILVSFQEEDDLERVWGELREAPWKREERTRTPPELLRPEEGGDSLNDHPRLTAKLQMAAVVLEELFRHFNDEVFEERLRPTMRPT